MKVAEFIEFAVATIQKAYPHAVCLYEQRKYSHDHYIWVMPIQVYEDINFADLAYEIYDKFEENEFEHDLVLSSEDTIIKPENPLVFESPLISDSTMTGMPGVDFYANQIDLDPIGLEEEKFSAPNFEDIKNVMDFNDDRFTQAA